jgi:hypothetical protein
MSDQHYYENPFPQPHCGNNPFNPPESLMKSILIARLQIAEGIFDDHEFAHYLKNLDDCTRYYVDLCGRVRDSHEIPGARLAFIPLTSR